MSRQLTQLTIFVSGTPETDAEKSACRTVVVELSKMLDKTHGITLRVLSWPDDVRPGVNTDPQAEINRQIGSGYDIYLGILGPRFGTPTARSESGTEEEFQHALARFQADSREVRLLFYFKHANEDIFSIDIEQFGKVKHFRESLGRKGVLYKDFQNTEDFVQKLKGHIHSLVVDEWLHNAWAQILTPDTNERGHVSVEGPMPITALDTQEDTRAAERTTPNAVSSSSSLGASDDLVETNEPELGYLDYREEFHRAAVSLGERFGQFTAHLVNLLGRLYARSTDLGILEQSHRRVKHIGGSREAQQYVSKLKKVVDELAADLEKHADEMTPELWAYHLESRAMFDNLRLALESQGEFQGAWGMSEEDRARLARLIEVMEANRQKISDLQTAIERVPAVTARFRRASKRTASFHGERIAEISFSIEDAKAVLKQIEGLMKQRETKAE